MGCHGRSSTRAHQRVYSAGLGLPFLVTGVAFGRLARTMGWARRHVCGLTTASPLALAGFRVLLLMDRLVWLTSQLQPDLQTVGLGRLIELG